MNNIGGIIWIKGAVNFALLEEAIQLFVQSHEGARIQITERNSDVFQYFEPYSRRRLRVLDFSGNGDPKLAASVWAETEFRKPFVLLEEPLFEFAMVKASEDLNGYFIKVHHLVSDGWSFQIMTEHIYRYYSKLRSGQRIEPEQGNGYADYIAEEQDYLCSARYEKSKHYWLNKFKTIPESFLLRSANDLAGKRRTYWLKESLSHAVKQYVRTHRCSINSFFLSLVLLHQHKITRQKDLIIGTPVLNRSGVKKKRIVGMFTSTIPFRTTVAGEESAADFIQRVNKELMESYFHQKYPYDLLVQELELRQNGYDQLFQISVNYYNTKLVNDWEGNAVENEELYCGQQLYSLQVVIKEWTDSGELELKFDYQTGDYTEAAIESLYRRLTALAEQVVNGNDNLTVGDLSVVSEQERRMLVHEWNETEAYYPKEKPVHQLIVEQAAETPDRIAAICSGRSLTYAELLDFSDRLAHSLASGGIGKGSIVALLMEHSLETLISIVGVLRTGAAYLPVDVAYPGQRIRYLLEDSRSVMLLYNVNLPEEIGYTGGMMRVDMSMLQGMPTVREPLSVEVSPFDPVYMIYTSGSTGKPKGVVVTHQGLANYTWWARTMYYTDEQDVAALYSSLAFDLTVTSIFPPLINGNAIAIYPAVKDEFVLERILSDNLATVLKLTPAHLSLIKHRDNSKSKIRMLIVGGEDLKSAVAADIHRSFGGCAALINEYGPTETVVGCITHRFEPETDLHGSVPIGRPIANTQIYLLDEEMQPVPEGTLGEIYIAGDGVAEGYWQRPELTKKQFVKNVFTNKGAMYKTDDLAIQRSDGSFEYRGRKDSQIKLNGYRIELGEIENHLMSVEGIREAVVVARRNDNGKTELVAYLSHGGRLTSLNVREALLEMLPVYLVPQYLIFMDKLPMTSNGKIDRKSLPDPETAIARYSSEVEPNERHRVVLHVMKDVLQLKHVSLLDNFYRLGGDSIKAIQAMAKLNEAGFSVQVKDILSFPVIGELASFIGRGIEVKRQRLPAEGDVQPTPITAWFFSRKLACPHHYNQSVLLSLKHRASKDQLSLALQYLARHHDVFRLKLDESSGFLRYSKEPAGQGIRLDAVSLDDVPEEGTEHAVLHRSLAFKQSLHMVRGPLFRGVLFERSEGKEWLLLTAHHLIVDAVSWRILLEDLNRILQAMAADRPMPLLARTDSYQTWADALSAYRQNKVDEELGYWLQVAQTFEPPWTADKSFGAMTIEDTETIHAEWSREDTTRLLTMANRAYNTRPGDLLVTALALACRAASGKSQFTIEMESHGREAIAADVDVSRTVGWFTAIYPVRLALPDTDKGEQLKAVKEQLRAVPNQGIGYGALAMDHKIPLPAARTIRFNYLGEIDDRMQDSMFELAEYATGQEQADENTFDTLLDLMPYIRNKQLRMSVMYSTKDFQPAVLDRFVQIYTDQLQELLDYCCAKTEVDFTPSDFDTTSLNQDELDGLFA